MSQKGGTWPLRGIGKPQRSARNLLLSRRRIVGEIEVASATCLHGDNRCRLLSGVPDPMLSFWCDCTPTANNEFTGAPVIASVHNHLALSSYKVVGNGLVPVPRCFFSRAKRLYPDTLIFTVD